MTGFERLTVSLFIKVKISVNMMIGSLYGTMETEIYIKNQRLRIFSTKVDRITLWDATLNITYNAQIIGVKFEIVSIFSSLIEFLLK